MKLSPFGNFFLLFIAHSPHSLAKHALHKRALLNGLSPSLRDGTPTSHSPHINLAASITQDAPNPSDVHQPMEADDIHLQGAPPSFSPLPLRIYHEPSQSSMLNSFIPNKKSKLSHDGQSHPPGISSTKLFPRFYSHASDLEQAFGNLHLHHDIKSLIKTIILQIPTEDTILHLNEDQSRIIANTLINADEVEDFLTERVSSKKEELASTSNYIRGQLLEITPVEHHTEVVTWVGTRVSAYCVRQLTKARENIEKHLESLSYLSSLYGLLGPKNLFFTVLQELLEDNARRREPPKEFDDQQFLVDIMWLHNPFTNILSYEDHLDASIAQGLRAPELPQDLTEKFTEFDDKYVRIFKQREEFIKLIDYILESDVVKSLQLDLFHPTELAGYELALIEPFGIGRSLEFVPVGEFSNMIGISSTYRIKDIFSEISSQAKSNMRIRDEIARKALRTKRLFLDDFTSNGLEALMAHLREAEQARQHQILQTTH